MSNAAARTIMVCCCDYLGVAHVLVVLCLLGLSILLKVVGDALVTSAVSVIVCLNRDRI